MESLVHSRERLYFGVSVVTSLVLYGVLALSVFGIAVTAAGVLALAMAHGLSVGHLKGNGVRVTARQFPEVHRLVEELAAKLELPAAPAVYVIQAGGLLNAFALRFLGRDFVVIYSDVLELAYANGERALAFVLAHELAHLKRGHLARRWVLYPSMLVPFLGAAYSRACEYTCDRYAAHFRPDGAADGLRVMAAGKRLYSVLDVDELRDQADDAEDFWTWFAEALSTHPYLPKRMAALPDAARAVVAPRPLV